VRQDRPDVDQEVAGELKSVTVTLTLLFEPRK
jgi:hypothetical protein